MTTLYLDNVTKVYDGAKERSVDTFTMHIDDGEIVALLGSSGCGKTTTLRMVAGFESVTEGEIRVANRVVNTLRPSQRNVAMAFESYALYPPLRVRENIAFGLLRDRVASAEIEKQVKQIAGMLEITDLLERFPPSISGGAQQRVSLARALIRNAAVYLLDEPMSQLEPQLRALLRARIKDYLIAAQDDDGGRDSRPDRSDRACRPHRGDGEGRAAAVRHAARSAGTAGQSVRGVVHRRAADEFIPRRGAGSAGLRCSMSGRKWPFMCR